MTYPLIVPVATHTTNPTKEVVPLSSIPTVNIGTPPTRNWKMLITPVWSRSGQVKEIVPLTNIPVIKVGLPAARVWSPLVLLGELPTEVTFGQWWPRGGRDRP